MSRTPRGRFAPSPSGRMHLGNVFCALIAWLSVRSEGGELVLRIEDLDPARSRMEYAERIEDDLRWLGLDWDGGGLEGGPDAPYFQSRRTALYLSRFERLAQRDLVYPCFCSRAELHAAEAPHRSDGQTVYSGRCRGLSREEADRRGQFRRPAWRLRVPDETVCFVDRLRGPQSEQLARECGDFVVRRSDGVFAYQLAVVVDDAAMGVTQVARGRDLLGSTARQILLYRLLELTPPEFLHVPLLVAPDGRRLSKREHDLDMGRLRERYPSPEPILGRLAFMSGLLDRDRPMSAQELTRVFAPGRLTREDIVVSEGDF